MINCINQFEFRKGYSTTHTVMTLFAEINRSVESGKIIVGVSLDMKKS